MHFDTYRWLLVYDMKSVHWAEGVIAILFKRGTVILLTHICGMTGLGYILGVEMQVYWHI